MLLLILLPIAVFIIYGLRPLTLWRLRYIPGPRPTWLLGNLPEIVKLGKHEAFRRWAQQYGPVYKVLEGGVPTIVIEYPEFARWVNARMPNRHPIPYMETGEEERFNAAGILFARNAHHRGLRGAWQPMFHAASLAGFMGLMVEASKHMQHELEKAADKAITVDIWSLFGDFTMEVSGATAFGNALQGELVVAAKAFFDAAGRIENIYALLQLAFPGAASQVRVLATRFPTTEYKEAMKGRRAVRAAVTKLLEDSRRSKKSKDEQKSETDISHSKGVVKSGVTPGSFLSLMARAINKDTGAPYTDMEVVCQAFSFVMAAYETTTATLAFIVYLLSINPEKEGKMLKEIDAFGRTAAVTYEDLHKFPYVEAVFKETLRLYPAVPLTIREADKTFQLGGYTIPQGSHLAVSMYGLHHSSAYWDKAEEFIPERFLDDKGCLKGDDSFPAYMPFGEGPRGCIGQRYAWQEVMVAVITLYQRFTFELEPGQVPLPVRMSLSLGPKDGVRVTVRRR